MGLREKLNLVFVGHVDHGKSTIVGRLLADTDSLPEGKLEQVKNNCEINSKPFEYAFLIDALKDEQSQGITIDAARVFFKTVKRDFIIIDAPGHIEFLKNMITGASRAEAALLVIDAEEGIRENSRRHGFLLSMLGVRQIAVLVNKMDLVGYEKSVYDGIVSEYGNFLRGLKVEPKLFIPVSGRNGDNITPGNNSMGWYSGKSVLELLDDFIPYESPVLKPFRMPVQDVYKFTKFGDGRRIVAGTIDAGSINIGDGIVFYPSGKKSRVKSIESFNSAPGEMMAAPSTTGLTLDEQIFIKRGELAAKAGEKQPTVSSMMRVSLFWLGKMPLMKKKEYILKTGTFKVPMKLDSILRMIDAESLDDCTGKDQVDRHDVAECILNLSKAAAFDLAEDNPLTSRFVIVDDFEIAGGGIIIESLDDRQSWVRDMVLLRNYKWERSAIPLDKRYERYNQKSMLILITGGKDVGKKTLARALEKSLFDEGKFVYFLGIGNVLYGVDADIKVRDRKENAEEHIRRLSEVSNILLDAGIILIVTAIDLTQYDLEIIKTTVNPESIEAVWVGDEGSTDMKYDLYIPTIENLDEAVGMIKEDLQNKGVIFRIW
ncbi:MAG: GTP-binding protein [Spirochaetes bacterium]|jgi:bifunctional enzyme CysN/CysC|nr:GTP-binding protein [Spirochaetota bacterium]